MRTANYETVPEGGGNPYIVVIVKSLPLRGSYKPKITQTAQVTFCGMKQNIMGVGKRFVKMRS